MIPTACFILDTLSLIDDCSRQCTMSAQLPHPSTPPSAVSGRAVFCSKIGIATQRQCERAFLLAQVDKSREPAIDKSGDISCAAPATSSSIERAHPMLQCSLMKQVNVPLHASTLSPIFDQPESITNSLQPSLMLHSLQLSKMLHSLQLSNEINK